MKQERVLAVKRDHLPGQYTLDRVASKADWETAVTLFSDVEMFFIPRHRAETSPAFKQIIPYIVFETLGRQFVCYRRNGTEKRLHGFLSLGIGGHIALEDNQQDFEKTVSCAMKREILEETGYLPEQMQFCGIINEEETAVGVVHIGLVFKIDIVSRDCLRFGNELTDVLLYSRRQFTEKQTEFELWSRLAMEII